MTEDEIEKQTQYRNLLKGEVQSLIDLVPTYVDEFYNVDKDLVEKLFITAKGNVFTKWKILVEKQPRSLVLDSLNYLDRTFKESIHVESFNIHIFGVEAL